MDWTHHLIKSVSNDNVKFKNIIFDVTTVGKPYFYWGVLIILGKDRADSVIPEYVKKKRLFLITFRT